MVALVKHIIIFTSTVYVYKFYSSLYRLRSQGPKPYMGEHYLVHSVPPPPSYPILLATRENISITYYCFCMGSRDWDTFLQ